MNTRPTLKDLYQYFIPQYAAHWRVIGTQLDLSTGDLEIIEYDNKDKAIPCCKSMLTRWLEMDTTASWGKLFDAIESREGD